ncbi:MAG TPA: hypothetical protein VNJ07_13210, partial [Chitinophagales bacterium]|nr:hypothetical protein [Chitinophagales bacterium]
GNQNFTGTSGWIENVIINKPSGTLFLINYITVGPDWIYITGNIDPGTSTVYFLGTGAIRGTHSLYNVRIQGTGVNDERRINSSDTLKVLNDLIIEGNNFSDIYDGVISAKGNVIVTYHATGAVNCEGNAYIVIDGTGNQILDGSNNSRTGFLPHIKIDKPSGTLFLKDTIDVERNWIYERGNVDITTYSSYVNFVYNTGPNYGTTGDPLYFIDGEGPSGYMVFDKIGLKVPRKLEGDVHIKNKLVIDNSNLILNGNDLHIENTSTSFIQRTSGYILSETPTFPAVVPAITTTGSIYWYIDNASAGTTYTFPFAARVYTPFLAYSPIFFDYSIQTAGTPSGGTGWISVATYPTDPQLPVNNRPLPPGVTNLNNFVGSENANRELDRYWVYECGNYSTAPACSLTMRYLDKEWNTGTNAINETLLKPHQWNESTLVWGLPGGSNNSTTNTATISNITACSPFTLVDPTLPDPIYHASDTLICAGDQVTYYDDNTVPPSSRQWYFPGGTPSSSTAASPVVTYNTPGTYDAILWSTYPGGTLTDTLDDYITVGPAMNVSSSVTHVLCNGGSNGAIDITPSGGSGIYEYSWSDGPAVTQDRTGLTAGTYTVTVSDTTAGGCRKTHTVTITEPAALIVSISNVVNVTCNSFCNGSARANPSGGTGTYTYSWCDGQTLQTASNLCAGTCTVTVTDQNGCTATASTNITQPNPISLTMHKKDVTCNGQMNGRAGVDATGGTGAYT